MAWIEQVPDDEATGELRKIYQAARGRVGSVANIIRVMSQGPRELSHFLRFYVHLMKGETRLPSREKELLAAVTSEVEFVVKLRKKSS